MQPLLQLCDDRWHRGRSRDRDCTSHLGHVPRCATTPGPAGNSCLSSTFLSGGNQQHRQVNTPDRVIRTRREGVGLASQLCSWGWPRDRPVGTYRLWFYSPSPNSAHQPDKGRSRDLSACGASLEQERGGNADPGARERGERAKRHLQNVPQPGTSRHARMPQWHAASPVHPNIPHRHGTGPCSKEEPHGPFRVCWDQEKPVGEEAAAWSPRTRRCPAV